MKKTIIALVSVACLLASNAHAAVITSSTSIAVPNNIDGVYINLVTGATSTIENSNFDINPYGTSELLFYWGPGTLNAGVAATTTGPYLDLAAGAVISSASTFSKNANGVTDEAAAFHTSGTHHLGLRFLNEATGIVNYGYLTLLTTGTSGFPATITGWSYEDTGAAIVVAGGADAAVPEPSTGWLAAFGALLFGIRKRRQSRRNQLA